MLYNHTAAYKKFKDYLKDYDAKRKKIIRMHDTIYDTKECKKPKNKYQFKIKDFHQNRK